MPKRETELNDEERSRRIRETAREVEASATREEFERAFKKIIRTRDGKSGKR